MVRCRIAFAVIFMLAFDVARPFKQSRDPERDRARTADLRVLE
jgi:hypothetical protein